MPIEQIPDASVRIVFCLPCGYLNRATKLAEALFVAFEDHIPSGVTLIAGNQGIFDVWFNDEMVFSKKQVDRFPHPDEIEGILEPRIFPG